MAETGNALFFVTVAVVNCRSCLGLLVVAPSGPVSVVVHIDAAVLYLASVLLHLCLSGKI